MMNGKTKVYVSVGEAARLTGLEAQTVRKMADNASFICYKTPSGQRRINIQSIQNFCSNLVHQQEPSGMQKKNFMYARVSTKKQMDDLSRQLEFLKRPEYSSFTVVTDIASGINFKRKGLSTILDSCLQGCIGEIVVAHRDRLCRFGFELIEQLVTKAGGRITVLQDCDNKTSEQELTEDLLSIIHVFSCRQMGRRSYANRKTKNAKDKDLPNETSKEIA
jgi:predicted site-specific integrase-resolvase